LTTNPEPRNKSESVPQSLLFGAFLLFSGPDTEEKERPFWQQILFIPEKISNT
jgi:hypothetical protein